MGDERWDGDGAKPNRHLRSSGRDVERIERELQEGVASGIAERVKPALGGTTSLVDQVRFNTGTWAIEKRFTEEQPADLPHREVLGSLVGRFIPAPVPVVIQTGQRELCMELMPGMTALEAHLRQLMRFPPLIGTSEERRAYVQAARDRFHRGLVRTRAGLSIAVFDSVVNNVDRHLGNVIVKRRSPIEFEITGAIDNAGSIESLDYLSLGESGSFRPAMGAEESIFARHWLLSPQMGIRHWKENLLHPKDVDHWLNGVEEMRGEFQSRGLPRWWEGIAGRLYAIGLHAKGTRRWEDLAVSHTAEYPASPGWSPRGPMRAPIELPEMGSPPISPSM
jgi:hypothetical protein